MLCGWEGNRRTGGK